MKLSDLVSRLSAYPEDLEVCIFDDWGSGYVLRPVSNVLDSTEFEQEAEDGTKAAVVAITYDLEA